jgi:hypothetical protein
MGIFTFFIFSLNFPINERLNYGGFFGPFRVGSSYLEISGPLELDNNYLYAIVSSQKTEGIFSIFFHINDFYCSYVDTASFSTLKFIKKIHEGNYKNEVTLEFTEDSVIYSNGKRYLKIPEAKDIFASLYYMRTLKFNSGDTLRIPFHSSGKNYEMFVPVSGPYKVNVPEGKFETLLLSPDVPEGKIFGSDEPIEIWVTNDSAHIPVKIQTHLKFGTVSYLLENIEIISGGE